MLQGKGRSILGVVSALWLFPGWAQGGPIIHEVFYDAVGPDSGAAFTEIHGPAGFDLSGWSLVGINGGTGSAYRSIDLTGALIPADGLLVIADSGADPLLAGVRDFVANVDWQNGPDAVQLMDPLASIVDAVQYGDAGPFNAGEGAPAPDAPAGSSLTRNLQGLDTNDNLFDFAVAAPSPGVGPAPEPPIPVPEPATWLLVASGLLIVGLRRR